jgi:putative ABC transport system permease protein
MKSIPPKWADKFLEWYCNPSLLDEIQGDVYELYERRIKDEGEEIANRNYTWDIIRFCRWSNIKRTQEKTQNSNNLPMLKNYIKVGFRNLSKHWITSGINIIGLAIAIGCATTTFVFIDFATNMDSFHTKRDNIYQIINHVRNEDAIEKWSDSPMLLGHALKDKYPSVEYVTRIEYQRANMRHAENKEVFSELLMYVDPDFMQMFDFPIRTGERTALLQKESIVISDLIAKKYFGEKDPIGQRLNIKFSDDKSQSFYVSAVLEKVPNNASFRPQVLIPIENFFDLKRKENYGWEYLTDATFISLNANESLPDFQMEEFEKAYAESNPKWPIEQFETINLKQLSSMSNEIIGSISNGGSPHGRIALGVIAFFLLILACFNYMNIAVASATKRLKEIAMRKVMGSARRNIINQFLIENMLLCTIALLIGIGFSYFLFSPGFDSMVPELELPFAFSSVATMVGYFSILLLLVGLASGAYPAFYISKFEPVHIFKGNQKFGSKNIFSKVLLTFQLFFAFTTVIGCFVFADNAIHVGNKDWGYDPKGIIAIPVNNEAEFNQLKNEAIKNPAIKNVAGSYGQIGVYDPMIRFDYLEKQFSMVRYKASENYFETNNVRLKKGRFFENNDEANSIVINETFVKKMGWDEPLKESIVLDSTRRNVIGVVQDFHHDFFYGDIYPVIFTSGQEKDFNYLTIQTTPERELEVDAFLKSVWHTISPDSPYGRKFQSNIFDRNYNENDSNISLILFISGIAILLACLGLFGLLSFNLQKKMKEIGVRKVLGASTMNIVKLANKEYSWILLIAFLLGAPLGYFMMNQLVVEIYADPKPASITPFLAAIIIISVTFTITVSSQIWKATKVNPADILRSE